MLKNYFIQVPMISGIPTLEPCIITTVSDSNDKDSDYVEMNDEGLKLISETKRGVYWRKDLVCDPNYEVDILDSEEVLKLFADYGIPLFLI